jgi:integrase
MEDLTLEDIKEILRIEVRKSILHSHHVDLGTSKYDSMKKIESVETISSRETKMRKSVLTDLKGVESTVDEKLQTILESLDIKFEKGSVNYKSLRRSFIDLSLLRYEWTKDLINESGRDDDDFRKEVDRKLKMNLFPELIGDTPSPVEQVPVQQQIPTDQGISLSPHQSTPISEGIEKYMNEKVSISNRSGREVRHSLNMLIEEFGDIPIGKLTRERGTKFKENIRKLPSNRKKSPEYRDFEYHELTKMEVKNPLSDVTVNKHLGYVSSFMEWSRNHGYIDINPFKGMKLKTNVRPRDQRDRFSEKELKQIFQKENYIHFTNIEKGRYELYWIPLIGVFSGLRLGEICPLYLDNIRRVEGHHRKRRWCFDILEEPNRTDKRLKNQSSRRVVPIHDILIEQLGFIEFIELLKKKDPKRERLFQELLYREGSYNKNVSTFFNKRYLPIIGLKTDKKNFHSLRHTVSDHLKQKGVEPHFINELLGHSSGNIDLERYGKGYNPDILYNKCVKKIFYETSHKRWIDFKSLKVDWNKIVG